MDKFFRTEQGELVNVVEHTLQQLDKWPHMKVYISTDSQDQGESTYYATAVVYRYGHRGAHYVFYREKIPRVRDMFTRLYNEAVRTIETAQIIDTEIPISFAALEFDYNTIPKWASNKLVSSVGGWVKGLNYNAVFKNSADNIMIAAKAADHCVRNH